MYKTLILSKIVDYLKLQKWNYKKTGKILMLDCPFCKGELCAQKMPNIARMNCIPEQKKFDLINIVKELEPDKKDKSEEDILTYLKDKLKLDVTTKKEEDDLDKILSKYEEFGFDLVPVANNGKRPIEKNWTNKNHKDKEEWLQWLNSGLNLGVKTGKISNLIVIDIDTEEIDPTLKKLLTNVYTLQQKTKKGFHFFFKYNPDLPKTRIDNLKIDIETDGGQVVIYPSIVEEHKREIELVPIIEMPNELFEFLKSKVTVPRKTNSEKIRENITTGNFKIKPEDFQLINNNLEGCCNSSFISLGGILRQELNAHQTEFVLQTFNRHLLENPIDDKAIKGMCRELDNYIIFDEQELAHEILDHLKDVKKSTKSDLELAISGNWTKGEAKKRFNKTIQYLIKEDKIIQRGKNIEIVEEMDWSDSIINVGIPIGFKVPYFHNYAYFNKGDIIILGSQNKYGKTTLAMNLVKRLVDQGIKPYYIYSESGGRWGKIALKLGLKDKDFHRVHCVNPDKVKLKEGSVTIYDWVRPNKQEGFARTDLLFGNLSEKVEKVQGFLICFVQLRDNDSFFAKDQIGQYPALLARYLYEDQNEGMYTYFNIDDVRESKIRGKHFKIPSIYDWDCKQVKLVEELSEAEQTKIIKNKEKNEKEK